MFSVFMLDLSFKETWAFEGELEMYIFLPETDVSDLMASPSSPYHKNQIIKTIALITYFGNLIFGFFVTLVACFSVRCFPFARQDRQEEMKNKQTST